MASSPSEFLTFYRRLPRAVLRQNVRAQSLAARPFSSTIVGRVGDHKDDKQHATRKDDSLDVQSSAVKHGTQSRAKDEGGHATQEKDVSNSKQKAKQEHPEAPDPAIGMQDERGGKGP